MKWRASEAAISISGGVGASPADCGGASVGVATGDAISSGVGVGSPSVGVALGDAMSACVGVAAGDAISPVVAPGPLAQPDSRIIASVATNEARSIAFQ